MVPRRELFVPVVDEGFFVLYGVRQLADVVEQTLRFQNKKEARMNIRINYIFWKEGHLLFDLAQSRLARLLPVS